MKKFISPIIALLVITCTSLTVFAKDWKSNESGGIWERGRTEGGPKNSYSYYYHSNRTHGATSQTDDKPGTTARVCTGSGKRAESHATCRDPDSWHPYWHFCQNTHGGDY